MFCTNCGTKAVKGDKFCSKCGTPIKVLANNVQQNIVQPDNVQQRVVQPDNVQQRVVQPEPIPPYYSSQPVIQRPKSVPERKSKFIPILIASVSVVMFALVTVALYFALGWGNNNRLDNGRLGDLPNEREELNINTDGDNETVPESGLGDGFEPEPMEVTSPEEPTNDSTDIEFAIIEDGTSFIFKGLEFELYTIDFKPMFAPADMPDGYMPFMVRFYVTPGADADEIRSLLFKTGYFVVDGIKAEFGAATIADENEERAIYSLISSSAQISEMSSIELHIQDYVFIVQ